MPSKYAKATAKSINGAELYNAVVSDTPALQNAGMPFAATASNPVGVNDSREIGNLLYTNLDLSNQFISSLLNQVALVLVQSKVWTEPWASLEKGKINIGEIVEEVFIKMSKPHDYNQQLAEQEVFKRDIPDVMTAFHALNYQKFYKKTISNEELRMGFNSWDALTRFISDIISSMFTSANYDSYQVKIYMIARAILSGAVNVVTLPGAITNKSSAEDAVVEARAASLNMTIMSPDYNYYQVPNFSNLEDQVIILNNKAAGRIDVSVLAVDFNMDKAEFLTMHRLAIKSFGSLDTDRLAELFANDKSYTPLTSAELTALDSIPFAIFDRSWFQIYDYFNGVTKVYNPDGLYWNYDYHVWKIFGASPFANAVVFSPTTPSVTSVTLSPATATLSAGQQVALNATVVTTGFAPQTLTWSTDTEGVTVNGNGVVQVPSTIASSTVIKVTATSTFDSSKSATATLTVA